MNEVIEQEITCPKCSTKWSFKYSTDYYTDTIDKQKEEIYKCHVLIKRMREALEFYATECLDGQTHPDDSWTEEDGEWRFYGKRARAALRGCPSDNSESLTAFTDYPSFGHGSPASTKIRRFECNPDPVDDNLLELDEDGRNPTILKNGVYTINGYTIKVQVNSKSAIKDKQ